MSDEVTTIPKKYIIVSDSAPASPFDGMWWRDTSENNIELNIYNSNSSSWELFNARGPDTPEYPVEGSIWRDTGAGSLKQYDGSSWSGVGVTDYNNLTNTPMILLDTYEDTNETSIFDYDSGSMVQYELYKIIGIISDNGNYGDIEITVNGLTTSDYRINRITDTITTSTGNSSFNGPINGSTPTIIELIVNGRTDIAGSDSRQYPTLKMDLGGGFQRTLSLKGQYDVDIESNVNEIRLFTSENSTGKIKIYGINEM